MARYCVGASMEIDGDEDDPQAKWDRCLAKRVFAYFRPYWRYGVAAIVCLAVGAALGLVPAVVTKAVIDALAHPDRAFGRVMALILVGWPPLRIPAADAAGGHRGVLAGLPRRAAPVGRVPARPWRRPELGRRMGRPHTPGHRPQPGRRGAGRLAWQPRREIRRRAGLIGCAAPGRGGHPARVHRSGRSSWPAGEIPASTNMRR
jgi:hypothetical protein